MRDKTINALFISSAFFLLLAVFGNLSNEQTEKPQTFTPRDFGSAPGGGYKWPTPSPKPEPSPHFKEAERLRDISLNQPIKCTAVKFDYIGEYFVTAYCPEECGGNWATASGEICHYSENPHEPTTCAIDRSLHGFYELIAVDFGDEIKVYITEDTGGNVRGRWVDCFVETMSEVNAWPTGYKSVYSVTFRDYETTRNERKKSHELVRDYLFSRSSGDRSDRGDDRRAGN